MTQRHNRRSSRRPIWRSLPGVHCALSGQCGDGSLAWPLKDPSGLDASAVPQGTARLLRRAHAVLTVAMMHR